MKNRKNTDVKFKFNRNLYINMNNIDDYNYQRCYNYNNYLSKQEFRERGVTVMSLVITIIVLLILAGITIKLALNDNGIIKQSKLASEEYQNKALQEQFALNQVSKEIEKASNSSSSSSSSGGGNQSTGGNSTSGGASSGSSENTDELKRQIDQLQAQVAALEANQATGNATASQVLAGATFSTSEGVGLTGTMVNHSAITTAISIGTDESKVYLRTSPGAYLTNATSGYPEICANISDINNATGYKYTKEQYDANYSAGYNSSSMKNLTLANAVTGGSQWQATGATNKQPITATYTPTVNCNYVIYAVIIQGDSRSDRKKVNGNLSAGSSTVIELPNSGGYDYHSERTWIATGHASAGQTISATFTADTSGYFSYSTKLNIYISE